MNSKVITWEELSQHSVRHSLWVLVDGNVYDVTTYLAEHPGGDDILLRHGGLDATAEFKKINHTPYAISLRDARLVGAITADPMPAKYRKLVEQSKRQSIDINKQYSWQEVALHNAKQDAWIVIEGRIYDVTTFLLEHPGGPAVLMGKAGDDATSAFNEANHSKNARDMLKDYQVGLVVGQRPKSEGTGSNLKMIVSFIIVLILLVLALLSKMN